MAPDFVRRRKASISSLAWRIALGDEFVPQGGFDVVDQLSIGLTQSRHHRCLETAGVPGFGASVFPRWGTRVIVPLVVVLLEYRGFCRRV